MLLRQAAGGKGIEVLMVRRSGRSAFAPDAVVFPGGTVDPIDYDRSPAWDAERRAAEFRAGVPDTLRTSEPAIDDRDASALVHAAVRELAEEANIELDPHRMHLFSHWITPPTEPRRYNTHFFMAPAGDAHVGSADEVETHDERWIDPAHALALYRAEQLHLVYPTIKHLERLTAFRDVESALRFAREKPIATIMPWTAPQDGFVMPAQLENAW